MDVFDLFAKLSLDTSEYDSGLSGALNSASSFGSALSGGLATACTVGIGAVTAVGTAVAGAGVALVSATGDVASFGDNIDKMSQKIGISAEAYQEWDAVMQHCGASIDSLQPSMKTLATQAEKGNEAFQQLGITEEEVANLSQEDLFAKVVAGLQNMEEGTERTYLASQLLGRGATELGALFNTSAEETQAMIDRVHELGGVMSDEAVEASAKYQDQLQDLTTAFDALKRNLVSDFMPSITTVMGGLTELFAGNYDTGLEDIYVGINDAVTELTDKLPEALDIVTGIFGALSVAVMDNASTIISALSSVVIDVIEQIAGGADDIVNVALDIINTLIDSISSALPELIPALSDGLLSAISALTDSKTITQLGKTASELIKGLATGITKALPTLLKTAPVIIGNLVSGMVGALGEFSKIGKPIMEAIAGIFTEENMTDILTAVEDMIVMIGDSLMDYADIVLDAVSGLLDALSESDEASEGLENLISSMIDQFFEFLSEYLPKLEEKASEIAPDFWAKIVEFVGKLFEKFGDIISAIAKYIPDIVKGLTSVLLESGTLQIMIQGWIDVFKAVVSALPDIIEPLLTVAPEIIVDLVKALIECAPDLIDCGIEITKAVVLALPEIISALLDAVPDIIDSIIKAFEDNAIAKAFVDLFTDVWADVTNAFEGFVGDAVFWGADLIDNFVSGITDKLPDLDGAVETVTKKFSAKLHHSKPDEGLLAHDDEWMPDMMKSFAQGIRDNTHLVDSAIDDAFDFEGNVKGAMSGMKLIGASSSKDSNKDITIVLELDKVQLAKTIYSLNDSETQRVGVRLANV